MFFSTFLVHSLCGTFQISNYVWLGWNKCNWVCDITNDLTVDLTVQMLLSLNFLESVRNVFLVFVVFNSVKLYIFFV